MNLDSLRVESFGFSVSLSDVVFVPMVLEVRCYLLMVKINVGKDM